MLVSATRPQRDRCRMGWSGPRGLLNVVGLFDLWAFAGVLAILAIVTLLAGIILARRVASVDPLIVLRAEPL